MGHNTEAVKRSVQMMLNEDLVRLAKQRTGNLSETVERPLAAFVEIEGAREAALKARCRQWALASSAFALEHGSPTAEYADL